MKSRTVIPVAASVAALSLGAFAARVLFRKRRPLPTVAYVDLPRYLGRWFEIARYPAFFERDCAKNTTAEYSVMASQRVRVENRCTTKDGHVKATAGVATVADERTNAKLKVRFGLLARGDYWIVGLDPDYRWAIVGEPGRRFLWILSRSPQLDEQTYASICATLPQIGYDPSQLVRTLQD